MVSAGRRVFQRFLLAAFPAMLALLLLLLPSFAAAEASGTETPENPELGMSSYIGDRDNWEGKVDCDHHISPNLGIDESNGKFYFELTISEKGNFDIEIKKKGTWKDKYLDFTFPCGDVDLNFSLNAEVNASVPCRMKGTYEETYSLRYYVDFYHPGGSTVIHTSNFKFDSIEPDASCPDGTQVKVYFGNNVQMKTVWGSTLVLKPTLLGGLDITGSCSAEAVLHKNEWDASPGYLDDSIASIHSCTEKGQPGCLEGIKATSGRKDDSALWFQWIYDFPVIGEVVIINPTLIVGPSEEKQEDLGFFSQSLTWKEKIKYKQKCEHMYYQVPVAVWADEEKTIPLDGVAVIADTPAPRMDPNVTSFLRGKTGNNPTIHAKGRTNLYLPWISGKYTIVHDRYMSDRKYVKMEGSTQQPTNMRREKNDRVDLILQSDEKVTVTVSKEWDIDLEDKDRPKTLEVLLQGRPESGGEWRPVRTATLSAGDSWTHTFTESKYRISASGDLQTMEYRVRELKKSSGQPPQDRVVEDTVEYAVPEYNTSQGELVPEHTTKYLVRYAETRDGDTIHTAITNTAILDFEVRKVWRNLPEGQTPPESVLLALCYRVREAYRDQVPTGHWQSAADEWIPVIGPLSGDMADILGLVNLEDLAKLDPTGTIREKLRAAYAVGIANEGNSWTLRFRVKKYGWDGVPRIPTEFQARELSEQEARKYFKLVTGIEPPFSEPINPGSGEQYESTPGNPVQLPGVHRDWEYTCTVINHWKKNSIGGAKYWVNDTAADRPDQLDIHVKDPDTGEEICDPIPLKKSDYGDDERIWYWTLDSSMVKQGVTLDPNKVYQISETMPDGYVSRYACEIRNHDIYNTLGKRNRLEIHKGYEPDDSSLKPEKVWFTVKDEKGQLIKKVQLPQGVYTITVTDGEDGVSLDGKDLRRFTIEEEMEGPTASSWVSQITGPIRDDRHPGYVTYRFNVKNRLRQNAVVTLKKDWPGAGRHPDHAEVIVRRQLYGQSPETLAVVTLNEGNSWSARIEKDSSGQTLKRYDDQGREYCYTVEEAVPEYYECTVTKWVLEETLQVTYAFTLRNTQVLNWVDVKGIKFWDDDHNSGGTRPSAIWIRLMTPDGPVTDRDGRFVEQKITSASGSEPDSWPFRFKSFPLSDELGQQIQYYVIEFIRDENGDERPIPGYSVKYHTPELNNSEWSCDITNSTKNRSIPVLKIWEDDDNAHHTRPDSVTIHLKQTVEGTITEKDQATLKEANKWYWLFAELPRYTSDGKPITYTVTEEPNPVPAYAAAAITGSQEKGFRITNKANWNEILIPVKKVWEGDKGTIVPRPVSVTVRLKRNGEDYKVLTLTDTDDWKGSFLVPRVDNLGKPYTYMLEEDPVQDYTTEIAPASISGSEKNTDGFTVTNSYLWLTIPITKIWGDGGTGHPNRLEFKLYQNGILREQFFMDTTKSQPQHTIYHLQRRNEQGIPYEYTLKETVPSGYQEYHYPDSISGDDFTGTGFVVTNARSRQNITVRKVWDDQNDIYHNRPDQVHIILKANGSKVDEADIKASENWIYMFQNKPVGDTDADTDPVIQYTVEEETILDEYEPGTISGNVQDGFVITNKLRTFQTTIKKTWADDDNRYGHRPSEVQVFLLDSTAAYLELITLNKDNGWQTVCSDLPLYIDKGTPTWHAIEVEIPCYQTTDPASGAVESGTVPFTNTLITKTDVTVKKIWKKTEGNTPEITVKLLSDKDTPGTMKLVTSRTVPESATPDPIDLTFEDQPVWAGARKIQYSVEEDAPEGYGKPVITKTEDYSFQIENTKLDEKTQVHIVKAWEDGDNFAGTRPESVTFHLLRDGDDTGESIELKEDDGWYGCFSNLPRKDAAGKPYTYSISEEQTEHYTTEIMKNEEVFKRYGIYAYIVSNKLDSFTITYDPNGGTIEGSKKPVKETYDYGTDIRIRQAPQRNGYVFQYWQGSEYQPGDSYTVTGDHTFTAKWRREDPKAFKFTFTKQWIGKAGENISWTLYNSDGSVKHKKFNKTVVSDKEWRYEAWFDSDEDYYLIEDVPEGYRVRYENIGIHAGETDRCYHGGTIINYRIPKTGDRSGFLIWLCMLAAGFILLGGAVCFGCRHRKKGCHTGENADEQ